MNFDWKKLIVDLLVSIFGEDLRSWFEGFFTASIPDVDPNAIIKVGDAPDVVHSKFQKWITDLITKTLSGNPVIFTVVKRFIPGVVDRLINNVWDNFFQAQIQNGTVPALAACGFSPKVMAAAPPTTAEIANLRAEAGLAA